MKESSLPEDELVDDKPLVDKPLVDDEPLVDDGSHIGRFTDCTKSLILSCCSFDVRLYDLMAVDLWPVFSDISCTSTPSAKRRVAAVARSEWFV